MVIMLLRANFVTANGFNRQPGTAKAMSSQQSFTYKHQYIIITVRQLNVMNKILVYMHGNF